MKYISTPDNSSHSKTVSKKIRSPQKKRYKLRQQIAVEAARLMSEEGIDNIHNARKKRPIGLVFMMSMQYLTMMRFCSR